MQCCGAEGDGGVASDRLTGVRRRPGKASIQTKLVLPGTNRDSLLDSNVSLTQCARKQRNSQQQCKKRGRERFYMVFFILFWKDFLYVTKKKKKTEKKIHGSIKGGY